MGEPGDTFALIFSAEDPADDRLSGMGVQVLQKSCQRKLLSLQAVKCDNPNILGGKRLQFIKGLGAHGLSRYCAC